MSFIEFSGSKRTLFIFNEIFRKTFKQVLSEKKSKAKKKEKEKKKGSLGHQFVFLLPKTRPHKNAPTDSVSFSVKDKAKNLLPQK